LVIGVGANHVAVGGHERAAIQAGVVGRDVGGRVGVSVGGARGEIIDAHVKGIEVGRAGNGNELAGAVRSEFGRVDAVEQPRHIRVFTHHEEVFDWVRVVVHGEVVHVLDIRVVGIGCVGVTAAEFVAANVVHGFLGGAILVDGPGKKLVEN